MECEKEFRNTRELWERFNFLMNANNSAPKNNLHNCIQFLKHSYFTKGKVWYDEFSNKIKHEFDRTSVAEWNDVDTLKLTELIQVYAGITNIKSPTVLEAVISYAHTNKRNEVKEWLESLEWDGVDRLSGTFVNYFGASESEYVRAISKNFWVSMVARVFTPGCKVDNMVILEGRQGRFKSTALSVIGGAWYSEINEQIGSKDFYLCLQGKNLLEISELDSFKKAEATTIKKVITCTSDRFRPPYGKISLDFPRQCIFVGTTNDDSYLKDATGGRRFWPIRTGNIDIERLKADRAQLFAEAVTLYKNGVKWWDLPLQAAVVEQETRRQVDPWEEILADLLKDDSDITVKEVFDRLGISYEKQNQSDSIRIAKILFLMGFEKYQRSDKGRTRAWKRIEPL